MTTKVQPMTTLNARELGHHETVNCLREMLVDQFRIAPTPESIRPTDPLFAAGVGLSSLEGMELLAVIEKQYGVAIHDLDHWVEESPTLDGVARYLIENTPATDVPR